MNMIIKHDSRWQRWRFECVHRKIPTDERKKNSKCNGEERQRDRDTWQYKWQSSHIFRIYYWFAGISTNVKLKIFGH